MPRGGKRDGAGRKKHSPNKKTVERKAKVAEATAIVLLDLTPEAIDAMTPKDVMRLVMTTGLKAGDLKMAYMAATDLAPYFHAKLSAVTLDATINADPATLSDAELERRIALRAKEIGKRTRVVH